MSSVHCFGIWRSCTQRVGITNEPRKISGIWLAIGKTDKPTGSTAIYDNSRNHTDGSVHEGPYTIDQLDKISAEPKRTLEKTKVRKTPG